MPQYKVRFRLSRDRTTQQVTVYATSESQARLQAFKVARKLLQTNEMDIVDVRLA